MRKQMPERPGRAGMTLIELLVVIAIIAVLVALTSAAVIRLLGKGPEFEARQEIGQLEQAIAACKAALKMKYLPSSFILVENPAGYTSGNAQHDRTRLILTMAFGKRALSQPVDWNGDGDTDDTITLQGHEALVFWLGGIPKDGGGGTYACTGFATGINPGDSAVTNRLGPFYNFSSSRLKQNSSSKMLYYLDPFNTGKPYAYFSSDKAGNDYGTADCSNIAAVVYTQPGFTSPTRFVNPTTFQIICAGPDGSFGTTSTWGPGSRPTDAGADNVANFARGRLGSEE